MVISELIEKLELIKDAEGDILVLVDGYELYWDDPGELEVMEVQYVPESGDYIGSYVSILEWDSYRQSEHFKAVVIPR